MRAAKHAELEPPHPGEAIWMAIEDRATVRQALASWREKLRDGADILDGMGGEIIWNHTEKFWANFNGVDDEHRQGHYWNPFGLVPERFRQNMIVEVNPAVSGKNTNVQGVVARDPGGQIWVLHGGRLHPPDHRVRGEEFDKIYKARRVVVQFDDGTTFRYHPVAMVNAAATRLQADTAAFVKACKYIRDYYGNYHLYITHSIWCNRLQI